MPSMPMMPDEARPVVGVLLAGGRARRMGGSDKSFLMLDGRPLLARAIERLAPQVATLVVSANGPREKYARLGMPVVRDAPGLVGPLAGFLAGMAWARANVPDASHIATAAVDTPFIPSDLVARLAAAAGGGPAVARSGGRVHPVFALLPSHLAGDLAAFLAARKSLKVADWLARHHPVAVDFGPAAGGIDPFFNVNTPQDLTRAEAMASGCADA
jgi:molybdopterin-guanine dinucleotide biosynthesis protein A